MNNSFLEDFKKQAQEEVSKLNYKKYFYQFNDLEKDKLTKEMKDIEIFFKNELEIDVYPIYGTLLGMIRDNDYIGWDTDIDMAYLSKCHTKKAVMNEFNMITKFLEEKALLLYKIKTMSHLHVWSPNKGLRIDLWISWIDEDGKYHLVWTIAGDIDASAILPFKTIEFKGQSFHLINYPDKVLSELYGDYNKSISGSETNWSKRKPVFELENWHGK